MKAYLILVTWPDGTEGLLFPRPGRVPVSDTVKAGEADFEKAKRDLISYAIDMWPPDGPVQRWPGASRGDAPANG